MHPVGGLVASPTLDRILEVRGSPAPNAQAQVSVDPSSNANLTFVASPRPFEHLRRRANGDPSGVFSRTPTSVTTNAAALTASVRLARELRRLGVRPGDIVAIDLPDPLRLLAIEAVHHEAAVPTVVPRGADAARIPIAWTLASRPAAHHGGTVVEVDAGFLRRIEEHPAEPEPLDPVVDALGIVWTGGTTRAPRAVLVGIAAYEVVMRQLRTWVPDGPFLSLQPASASSGFGDLMLGIAADQPSLSGEGATPAELLALIDAADVTTLKGSPHQLRAVVDEARRQGRGVPLMQSVVVTGGTLSTLDAELLLDVTDGCAIAVMYGTTEVGQVTRAAWTADRPGLVGRPVPGAAVEVVDEHDVPLPHGRTGRIRVRTAMTAAGYLGDPEATARVFRDGWFDTGDRGWLDEDGALSIVGRTSELIDAGTAALDPLQIDHAALGFAHVRDACGFAAPTASGIDRIGLAVEVEDGFDRQALIVHLRETLGPAAPTLLAIVDEIPRSASGRPLRLELSARYAEH